MIYKNDITIQRIYRSKDYNIKEKKNSMGNGKLEHGSTQKEIENNLGCVAFWRKALWKSLGVRAVIVDHIILLHPREPLLSSGIQLF